MGAPVLAAGDGALGFWKALREVFPTTKEQRCSFHVQGNVLAALPKSAHPGAKAALAKIFNAQDKDHAMAAAKTFEADYGPKWPKAVAKITEHLDVLLAFYDFPAEHWIHLRTTNPIESTFATIRLRQRVTKGPGSRAAGVAMAFKLIESRPTPVARPQRTPPRGPRTRRSPIPEGQARGTTRRIRRRSASRVTPRSTGLDYCSRTPPAVLTSTDIIRTPEMCLRTAELRPDDNATPGVSLHLDVRGRHARRGVSERMRVRAT